MPEVPKRGRARELLSLLPTVLLLLGFAVGNGPSAFFLLLFAVLLHEGGHAAAFCLLGAGIPRLKGERGGLLLSGSRPLSPREEAAVAAAGPLANLLAAGGFLFLFARSPHGEWCFTVFTLQLLTALANLLPLEETDGGRLLRLAAGALFGMAGRRACHFFFLLLSALLFFLGGYLYGAGKVGLSLPLFCALTLLRTTKGADGSGRIWKKPREFSRFRPENREICGLNEKNTENSVFFKIF